MATGHHRRPGTDTTVEELGKATSVELPAAVATHLEAARWELKNLA